MVLTSARVPTHGSVKTAKVVKRTFVYLKLVDRLKYHGNYALIYIVLVINLIFFVGIFTTNAREQLGSRNVSIQCDVKNLAEWKHLMVYRNNQGVIRVVPEGTVQSRFHKARVAVEPTMAGDDINLKITFASFRCMDEGLYTCTIDQNQETSQDVEAIVTSK